MPNATIVRNKQQADLLQQLEAAGATTTISADLLTLDDLQSNSTLVEDILHHTNDDPAPI